MILGESKARRSLMRKMSLHFVAVISWECPGFALRSSQEQDLHGLLAIPRGIGQDLHCMLAKAWSKEQDFRGLLAIPQAFFRVCMASKICFA